MPFIRDASLDLCLADINDGTRIDICYTQEPTTYTEATSTYSCGNKTGLTVGAPAAGATDGRSVTVPAITDGSSTDTQTAGWWALTDGASVLYAAGALSSTQATTSGNTFTLDAIIITVRDATVTV